MNAAKTVPPVLVVKDLVKQFPGRAGQPAFTAIDHLSFDLRKGEILGLLGPNGAGKTTTMQILLSTLLRTSGSIEYFGLDFDQHRSRILERVSFASTYINLPGHLTIYENLMFQGMLHGIGHKKLKETIKHFLNFFNMAHKRDHQMDTLSAGQKTRVMLCKAFIIEPDIVLLDEPTASLDLDVAQQVRAFILEQQRQKELSILFTSHNMDEVAMVCGRVLVLKQGKLIADDNPAKLAASISLARVNLFLVQAGQLERLIDFSREHQLSFSQREQWVTFEVNEQDIAPFLMGLAHREIQYTQITIDKPSLEDYFLHIAHKEA